MGYNFFKILLLGAAILICLQLTVSAQTNPGDFSSRLNSLSGEEKVTYLGELCWQNRNQDTEFAIECGLLGVKLADSLDMQPEKSQINNFLGVAYINDSNHKDALQCLYEALRIGLHIKDSLQVAYAYNNIGNIYISQRNYPLSIEYSKKALDIFSKLNNKRGIAFCSVVLGSCYAGIKQYDLGLSYYNQAYKTRQELGDTLGAARVLSSKGYLLEQQGDFTKAKEMYDRVMKISEKFDYEHGFAAAYDGLGYIYYQEGRFSEAEKMFNDALRLNEKVNSHSRIISNKLGLALVYSKTNKQKEGLEHVDSAIKLFKENTSRVNMTYFYDSITEFYTNLGDYQGAIKKQHEFLHIYDSLLISEKNETITQLQNIFRIEEDIIDMKSEMKYRDLQNIYLLGGIVLMVALGLLLLSRYATKKNLNKQLRASNATKDKFFKIIAHDLRSPFISILGTSEMFVKEQHRLTKEEIQTLSKNMYTSIKTVFGLLTNLLEWSKLQTDTIAYSPEKFYLKPLVDEVLALFEVNREEKNLDISNRVDKGRFVYADKNMIETVIRNLVSNAIKFTHSGGTIAVFADRKNNHVEITVEDTGVGIKQENLDKLFLVGEHVSSLGTGNEPGTGMGLVLCKDFVEKNGGTIEVNSSEDKGSTFKVILPAED